MDIFSLDFSNMEGTGCYCSEESAAAIRRRAEELPSGSTAFIGSGDCHYISLFRAETIREDFTLVLIDNHSDDQNGAFDSDILSCGNWVLQVRKLPRCKKTVWIRNFSDFDPQADYGRIFLSIDLDALSREWARTDWDQGDMSLEQLTGIVRRLAPKVILCDICGALSESKGGSEADSVVNTATIHAIAEALDGRDS